MELNAKNVMELVSLCIGEDSNDESTVKVDGVVNTFLFNKEKIGNHKDDIKSLLMQLNRKFFEGTGGGWSFLKAVSKLDSEEIWGEQKHAEMLMCLGIAAGYVSYLLPRNIWPGLPGGVPYFVIKFDKD